MAKHTQTICRLLKANCLSVFDHFVGLSLKGLKCSASKILCKHISARCFFKLSFKNFKNPCKLLVIEMLFAAIKNDFLRPESLQK